MRLSLPVAGVEGAEVEWPDPCLVGGGVEREEDGRGLTFEEDWVEGTYCCLSALAGDTGGIEGPVDALDLGSE